jgi:hypothetical protein
VKFTQRESFEVALLSPGASVAESHTNPNRNEAKTSRNFGDFPRWRFGLVCASIYRMGFEGTISKPASEENFILCSQVGLTSRLQPNNCWVIHAIGSRSFWLEFWVIPRITNNDLFVLSRARESAG